MKDIQELENTFITCIFLLAGSRNQKINFTCVSLTFFTGCNRSLILWAYINTTKNWNIKSVWCTIVIVDLGNTVRVPAWLNWIYQLQFWPEVYQSHSSSCCTCSICTLNPANYWLALKISKSLSHCPVFGYDHRVYGSFLLSACFILWYKSSRHSAELQLIHSQRINTS